MEESKVEYTLVGEDGDVVMRRFVLVTGSRKDVTYAQVEKALDHLTSKLAPGWVLVHGGARGADTLAGLWAKRHGVEVEVHEADWNTHMALDGRDCNCPRGLDYCRVAGFRRNQAMVGAHNYIGVVAFPRGEARGTWDCVDRARAAGLRVAFCYE